MPAGERPLAPADCYRFALSHPDVNVCVNSDMTVSCTCHDVDASGHIGDLSEQSLAEVFSGETADRFRRTLAEGRLPTPLCPRCWDLKMVDKDQAVELAGKHVMVERPVAIKVLRGDTRGPARIAESPAQRSKQPLLGQAVVDFDGGRATIVFHDPVRARDFADRKALAEHCWRAVERGLEEQAQQLRLPFFPLLRAQLYSRVREVKNDVFEAILFVDSDFAIGPGSGN